MIGMVDFEKKIVSIRWLTFTAMKAVVEKNQGLFSPNVAKINF